MTALFLFMLGCLTKVPPTYPATGYGYIKSEKFFDKNKYTTSKVDQFIEKPDVKTKSLPKKEIKVKTSAKEKRPSGEVKTKDLNSMTLSELKKEAKSKEISGISSMKKSDLIAALSKK